MEPNNLLSYINCIKLLENFNQSINFSITSIVVESLNEKVSGMMAEYYKLIIYVKIGEKNIQQNFFCKKLIMFHKIQEIMGKAQGAYEKEEFIYQKFCGHLEKMGVEFNFAPKCYLTLNHDVFILEELLEKGYCVNHENFDLAHVKIALKTIAEFHACSIILERHENISLLDCNPEIIFADSLYRKSEEYLGRKWFKNCLNAVIKVIDFLPSNLPYPKETIKTRFKEKSNKIYEIITPSKKYMNVCCHGDLSKLNILFKYEEKTPTDCKIVDFQALRYNPPAHDVVNLIFLCSSYKLRQVHYSDLLDHYYNCLSEKLLSHNLNLVDIIPKASFLEACDFVLPQAIIQRILYNTMNPVIRLFPIILKDQDLYKKYVYEDRSEECLVAYEKSEAFREMMMDNITEFCQLDS